MVLQRGTLKCFLKKQIRRTSKMGRRKYDDPESASNLEGDIPQVESAEEAPKKTKIVRIMGRNYEVPVDYVFDPNAGRVKTGEAVEVAETPTEPFEGNDTPEPDEAGADVVAEGEEEGEQPDPQS
jgi:hypothetical protein